MVNLLSFFFFPRQLLWVIDNAQQLAVLLPKVKAEASIALDTEADSLHAYPEKLCLLQLSLPGTDVLIDPLAALDLQPLFKSLLHRELVFHGADYDLRLLYRTFGFVPTAVFDTMWAARLLGYREFGLRDLVERHLGVGLEKGPQKMNWALRPLPDRMVTYALNDTRYLRPLAELLQTQLAARGRLEWLREICARVIDVSSTYTAPDPEEVWRVKGSDKLDPASMAVLRELWRWREEEARSANKPPYFILSHEALVRLSAAATRSKSIRHLIPHHLSTRRADRLTSAIESGLAVPAANHPQRRRSAGVRLTQDQQRRFDQLKALRDACAEELGLDQTIIASKSDLILLARNGQAAKADLMVWQRHLLQLDRSEDLPGLIGKG